MPVLVQQLVRWRQQLWVDGLLSARGPCHPPANLSGWLLPLLHCRGKEMIRGNLEDDPTNRKICLLNMVDDFGSWFWLLKRLTHVSSQSSHRPRGCSIQRSTLMCFLHLLGYKVGRFHPLTNLDVYCGWRAVWWKMVIRNLEQPKQNIAKFPWVGWIEVKLKTVCLLPTFLSLQDGTLFVFDVKRKDRKEASKRDKER